MGATSHKSGCAFCGALKSTDGGPLSQCKQCKMAAYCGEEHQSFDWKRHKPLCKTVQSQLARNATQLANGSKSLGPLNLSLPRNSTRGIEPSSGTNQLPPSSSNESLSSSSAPKYQKFCSGEKICERLKSSNNLDSQVENTCLMEKVSRKKLLQKNFNRPRLINHATNPIFTTTLHDHLRALAASGLTINQQQAIALRLKFIAEHVIKCLNEYGWAIVDDFIGETHCNHVHREMNHLYNSGIFTPGQVMETRANTDPQCIRSDKIYWFDNTDERVSNAVTVRLLVSMIDSIVIHFNGRVPYKIIGRSRAMMAVYPSNGTHYVKHIDNPVKDGRCVTSIYYCNQDWNVAKDGGCLRLYPETSDVPLDIEPRGDRLVFLWSDRRNPHEVRPVYKDRYAITIWYFDTEEKLAAMARKRENDALEEAMKSKQQPIASSTEQASVPQLAMKNFVKLEPDQLSSHDTVSNQTNIFHSTISPTQQVSQDVYEATGHKT